MAAATGPAVKVTFLGCGSSGGVPLPTGNWGICDPSEPKNRRRRSSILLEIEGKVILVDMGPDLREQLLAHGPPPTIDAVILTHHHADHIHGLDDVRHFVYARKEPLPLFLMPETAEHLRQNISYITEGFAWYPPLFDLHETEPGQGKVKQTIAGFDFTFWRQPHGRIETLGFQVGRFGYSTDCVDLSDDVLDLVKDMQLHTWVVDAVRKEPHAAHAHLEMTLSWLDRIRPENGVITHMSEMMDYQTVLNETPDFVVPAFDGMIVETPAG